MRQQEFLSHLANYQHFTEATELASGMFRDRRPLDLVGGWEVWLQVEFAMHLLSLGPDFIIMREVRYPTPHRCDFFVARQEDPLPPNPWERSDATYIELKCQLPGDTIAEANGRYTTDIEKIRDIVAAHGDINAFALLAVVGTPDAIWDGVLAGIPTATCSVRGLNILADGRVLSWKKRGDSRADFTRQVATGLFIVSTAIV